jgi:hypothetical protein
MADGEISKTLPYSPHSTELSTRKCRKHCGLTVRAAPETHERQFLLGSPSRTGLGIDRETQFHSSIVVAVAACSIFD